MEEVVKVITEKIKLNTTLEERLEHIAQIYKEIISILGDTETYEELDLSFVTWIEEESEVYVLYAGGKGEVHTTQISIKHSPAEALDFVTTIPITCEKENYFFMTALLNRLNNKRFGAFYLNESDGSITYRYSYCVFEDKFNHGYFVFYLRAIKKITTDCFEEIRRIAVGGLSKAEKHQFLCDIKRMAESLI